MFVIARKQPRDLGEEPVSQPHITELGAFDPIQAFYETFSNLTRLFDGLNQDPEALPPEEIIRATIVSVDLLEAITETTLHSMLLMLAKFVPPEVYEAARTEYMLAKETRTPDEAREYKMTLMRKITTFIPHEAAYPKDEPPPAPDA